MTSLCPACAVRHHYPRHSDWRCADPTCTNAGVRFAARARGLGGSFPESWGPPPANATEREAWIRQHATVAHRGPTTAPRSALRDLERKYRAG